MHYVKRNVRVQHGKESLFGEAGPGGEIDWGRWVPCRWPPVCAHGLGLREASV
jgi:hypothetical protein